MNDSSGLGAVPDFRVQYGPHRRDMVRSSDRGASHDTMWSWKILVLDKKEKKNFHPCDKMTIDTYQALLFFFFYPTRPNEPRFSFFFSWFLFFNGCFLGLRLFG